MSNEEAMSSEEGAIIEISVVRSMMGEDEVSEWKIYEWARQGRIPGRVAGSKKPPKYVRGTVKRWISEGCPGLVVEQAAHG